MQTPKVIAMLAVAAVLGGVGGAVVVGVVDEDGGTTTTVTMPAPASADATAAPSSGALSAKEVYRRAKDSVAFITAEAGGASSSPFGPQRDESGAATGSGFVVDDDGSIVTNAHVVDGATSITVKVGDGKEQRAELVGADVSTDLALLKVRDADGLEPLPLGDSDAVAVGDPTFAIGNPFGLDRTLTTGVVSALQRQITAPNGFSIDGVIQTDAPINPGNSGGPLLDAHGRVIGVNSQILTGSSVSQGNVGIGFAVPSNTVRNVVEQLRKHGSVAHAYLGVRMATPTKGDGALVAAVTAGSPADRGGLDPGDVIVSFDGEAVEDPSALARMVNARRVGEKVELTVRRGGERLRLRVTLGAQPASATGARLQRGAAPERERRGLDPRELPGPFIP